jgi:PTH1 family peptidyl-tRNA hydrolase
MRLFRRGESASTLELLVAGLGNPGPRHERDRHNVGWMVVDELGRRHAASFRSKFNGRIADLRIDDHRLALLEPETYMNDSGRSIAAAARFYKVEPVDVLVVHDDVDLEFGRLQARAGGGLAGHNGLRSIAQVLGTPDFVRMRVGVGRPSRGDPRDLADFVLSPFELHEDRDGIVARAADAVEVVVAEGLAEAQRRFNERD